MNGPRGHFANGKKGTTGQIPHNPTYEVSNIVKGIEAETRMVVPWAVRRRIREVGVQRK